MNGISFFSLCLFVCLGIAQARTPDDLSKLLKLGETQKDGPLVDGMREEHRKEPGTLIGNSDFDISHYLSQFESIEAAKKNLGTGDVEQYMPAPIQTVECHVEFQVTQRVPGRCTKLAGTIPACQAEKYIGINYNECS